MTAAKISGPSMVHHPACKKPDAVTLCKCGANVQCRTCGWGRGVIPCKCLTVVVIPNG